MPTDYHVAFLKKLYEKGQGNPYYYGDKIGIAKEIGMETEGAANLMTVNALVDDLKGQELITTPAFGNVAITPEGARRVKGMK